MTTLSINCELRCDRLMKRAPGALVLERVYDYEPPVAEEEWTVNAVETIQTGPRFCVFRAQIIRSDGDALDAVLKIDPTGECEAACKNELKVYQTKGKVLQGTALPEFYGCFQVRIGAAMVTCLAMEYCGEPLKKDFDELDSDLIGKLLIAVAALHGWGLTHGDLYPRNVRVVNEHPVLIDFESSESHTCGLRMQVIQGTTMPTPEEYGCTELHHLVWRMGLWEPGSPLCYQNNPYSKKTQIHSALLRYILIKIAFGPSRTSSGSYGRKQSQNGRGIIWSRKRNSCSKNSAKSAS
ncbi:hypothetical protein B0H15DRAFT_250044 [Mycena belliarum]|uniref:Protein kinase domain-containing protein n=1 Tax=Mycena belliarum TaxID=1033014 RepID=A0AAD6U6E8_9AGAR|nr:hypothetical protein B0H15DRAFT_250044 [Mycena belliae]